MPEKVRHAPLDVEKMKSPTVEIHLLKDECKGCGYCIEFCPRKVLEQSDEINARGVRPPRIVDESKCINCSFCSIVCPDFAIFVTEKKSKEEK